MSQSQVSASALTEQKSYVTYTAPTEPSDIIASPSITLLEARNLIAASGTTGKRTWEASLHLGTFLFSTQGKQFVHDKNVIEVGAGTGFVSLLCAKHLGARFVLATDGNQEVVDDLSSNVNLNGLRGSTLIKTAILKWGHSLNAQTFVPNNEEGCDMIFGADVVGISIISYASIF